MSGQRAVCSRKARDRLREPRWHARGCGKAWRAGRPSRLAGLRPAAQFREHPGALRLDSDVGCRRGALSRARARDAASLTRAHAIHGGWGDLAAANVVHGRADELVSTDGRREARSVLSPRTRPLDGRPRARVASLLGLDAHAASTLRASPQPGAGASSTEDPALLRAQGSRLAGPRPTDALMDVTVGFSRGVPQGLPLATRLHGRRARVRRLAGGGELRGVQTDALLRDASQPRLARSGWQTLGAGSLMQALPRAIEPY